jgi:hypothetical protein
MAILVLVLWLFTAGAGFYLLVTSNLGRARPAPSPPVASASTASPPATSAPAANAPAATPSAAEPATASVGTTTAPATPAAPAAATQAAAAAPAASPPPSKRELRRAARDRFDPPSLTAAKNAPVVPGLRSLLEFAHPASATVGLGFWLAFTFVHVRALGWIGFGLVTVTVCLGLTWYTANTRAARRTSSEPAPSFSTSMVILHGSAAALTFVLAALTALVLSA